MLQLNLISPEASNIPVEVFSFPDGQPQVKIETTAIKGIKSCHIFARVANPNDLLNILLCKNILDYHGVKDVSLGISYLLAARMDRVMTEGEPFTLKVIASILNQAKFSSVKVFDPHSDVSTALIESCKAIPNHHYVKDAIQSVLKDSNEKESYFLVSPDAGALKKIHGLATFLNHHRVIEGIKTRNVETGKLSNFKVFESDLKGKTCVVVDDICDGGRTFSGIGEALKEKNAGKIILIVSHGVFSKGYTIPHIDLICATNSYKELPTDQNGLMVYSVLKYL
ncbi:MAG TPA: phosphoribosyltransferase family protein [Cyclobacteriaceae bacterium]|nr:phosphoribosyltransferase family protein [Cyclobacteriaceae bacterium]